MSPRLPDARDFWDREISEQRHVSWLEDPLIHEYANRCIGGDRPMWPLDWLEQWLGGRKFGRALSIGCGGGALERDLVRRGLCASVDAFDGSIASLRLARNAAAADGVLDRIHYFAADFNEPFLLRRRYDAVFIHQAAHHVAKLEKLYRAILHALRGDGLLYLDEYVGPSRFEWTDDLLEEQRRVYSALPAQRRRFELLPFPIQQDDPSEAFRSSEIEPQLEVGFDVVARRPYGGTLLSVLFPALLPSGVDRPLIERMIEEERGMLARGAPPYYAIIVARPKRGLSRIRASAHYWLLPKLKRVGRELRRVATSLRR